MSYYIINGSPRKNCNTSQLLKESIKGIKDNTCDDSVIELINLYDLDYKGCKSCFHCKKINGKYYGECPIKDDLKELLPRLWSADAIIFGSPIYFGNITGELRSLLERFLFPKLVYGGENLLKNTGMNIGLIYTMNFNGEYPSKYKEIYQNTIFTPVEDLFKSFAENIYSLKVYDTYQFKDYSKYENYVFDEKEKMKRRKEHFPIDLKNAYELGEKISK